MDPSLEEAARLSGANPFRVFREITLPLIRPGLISGMVLVFLAASASFGVPALVGRLREGFFFSQQNLYLSKDG